MFPPNPPAAYCCCCCPCYTLAEFLATFVGGVFIAAGTITPDAERKLGLLAREVCELRCTPPGPAAAGYPPPPTGEGPAVGPPLAIWVPPGSGDSARPAGWNYVCCVGAEPGTT